MKRVAYFHNHELEEAKKNPKPKPDYYRLTVQHFNIDKRKGKPRVNPYVNPLVIGESKDWKLLLMIAQEIYPQFFYRIDPIWN